MNNSLRYLNKRSIFSCVSGLIYGSVIGYLVSWYFGEWLVGILRIPSFEGRSGFGVLAIMMVGIPIFTISFGIINIIIATRDWPVKTLIIQGILAVLAFIIIAINGIY